MTKRPAAKSPGNRQPHACASTVVGDVIKTFKGGRLVLGLSDGSQAIIAEQTTVEITDLSRSPRTIFNVLRGKTRIKIEKMGDAPTLTGSTRRPPSSPCAARSPTCWSRVRRRVSLSMRARWPSVIKHRRQCSSSCLRGGAPASGRIGPLIPRPPSGSTVVIASQKAQVLAFLNSL
jgi:hypothetical protein